MIRLIVFFALFCSQIVRAQSPYLGIHIKMDSVKREDKNFRISMKICEPLKMTERGDWFKPDTSAIDFLKLTAADLTCGKYSYIEGTDDYAGSQAKFNVYEFGNQLFAWKRSWCSGSPITLPGAGTLKCMLCCRSYIKLLLPVLI